LRVCVLGADGYLGWPTSMYLSSRGHEVLGVDSCVKRRLESDLGVVPLDEVADFEYRAERWNALTGRKIETVRGDIYMEPGLINYIFAKYRPEAIIHYAEQPSAPYSMMDREACSYTQVNNVVGTLNVMFAMHDHCPDAHLIKLGTMGEYGTPNIDIEEGWIEITHRGRSDRMIFPKKPASFYHCSKVHDSTNLEFACRSWGMRVTDLNQGVVYGIDTDEMAFDQEGLRTSFHYDDVFGTALNRFVVQAAIGMPLTVYGDGSQTRGYLNIKDTLQCVELAALNPADAGEFRVFNQFTESFGVLDLALWVKRVAEARGLSVDLQNLPNPRVEATKHYYNPVHSRLLDLGLRPHLLNDAVIDRMLERALASKERVRESSIAPRVTWSNGKTAKTSKVGTIEGREAFSPAGSSTR
jgi:UDP-sulfoquinovose synthase